MSFEEALAMSGQLHSNAKHSRQYDTKNGHVIITSDYRPGARTKSGKPSHHAVNGDAWDIVPANGWTYANLRKFLNTDPVIGLWFKYHRTSAGRDFKLLDETSSDMMDQTGATGPHFHISSDGKETMGRYSRKKEWAPTRPANFTNADVANERRFLEEYDKHWKGTEFDSPIWRDYWYNVAWNESHFRPDAIPFPGQPINKQAYGYFQVMPGSRTGLDIDSQFKDTMKLHTAMVNSLTKYTTQQDIEKAAQKGIKNKYGLFMGAWLSGSQGILDAIRGVRNPKDKKGTDAISYAIKGANAVDKDYSSYGQDYTDDDIYEEFSNYQGYDASLYDTPSYNRSNRFDQYEENYNADNDYSRLIEQQLEEAAAQNNVYQLQDFIEPDNPLAQNDNDYENQLLQNLSVIDQQQQMIDQLQREKQLAQQAYSQDNLFTPQTAYQPQQAQYSEPSPIEQLMQNAQYDNSTAQQILSSLWSQPREDFAFANNPLLQDKEGLALAYQTAQDKMIANGGHLHELGGDNKKPSVQAPKDATPPNMNWHNWWLQNRAEILGNNIKETEIHPIWAIQEAFDWNFPGLKKIGADRAKKQIERAKSFKEYIGANKIPDRTASIIKSHYRGGNEMTKQEFINYFPAEGLTNWDLKTIWYPDTFFAERADTHERTHALNAYPQEQKIGNIFKEEYDSNTRRERFDDYLEDPSEVYARLMDFREAYNLDPNKKITKKDLEDWKSKGYGSGINGRGNYLLDRYNDEVLLRLFNEVAENEIENTLDNSFNTVIDSPNITALGGRLYGDGGDGGINRDVSSIMQKYKGTIHDINVDKDAFTKVNSLNSTLDNIGFSEDTELQHDLADYFISYVNSDGYDRIQKNQKDWWNSNHPILKHFDWLLGMDEATRALKRNTSRYAYNVPVFTMEMPVTSSFAGAKTGNVYLGIYPTDDFPYPFVAGHEFAHQLQTNTPSLGIQDEALKQNTNTRLEKSYSRRMHDSRPIEKHADVWGLKYLLYKTGIYDSRSNKDITPAQVQELRDLYPGLRPLKQMNNKKAAWMLNHTAKNEMQNAINDNVFFPQGNYAAFGGNLFKDGGGLLDNLMNAVDTVKQRTQKSIDNTRKQAQEEGYIYKNGKLTKKGRHALRSQHGITGRLMNETQDIIDKTERNLMLQNPIKFYDKKSEWFPGYKQVELPWYKDQVITLQDAGSLTGAKISANMFDSLYKAVHYNPQDMDIVENIGAKETTFGNPTDDNSFFKLKTSDKPTIALLKAINKANGNKWGNVQHINHGQSLTGSGLLNFGAWPNPWEDAWATASDHDREEDVEKIKQRLIDSYNYTQRMDDYWRNSGEFDKNVIQAAVELYKKGRYNPGQGNYVEYSTKKGNELRNSPTYKKYILPKRSKHSKRVNKDDIWL